MIKTARFQRAVTTLQGTVCVLALTVGVLAILPGSSRADTDYPRADTDHTRADTDYPRADTDYTRPGPYLGVGVAGGLEDFGGGRSAFGDSAGLTVRGGYRLAPYFAVEGLYEYMDDFGLTATTLGGTKVHEDIRTHNFSLMGKAIFPLGFVQPYLSGGVGLLNADSTVKIRGQELHHGGSATEFAGRVGAGLDLFATPQLALTLDSGYVLPTGGLEDFNYISFGMGVRYTF